MMKVKVRPLWLKTTLIVGIGLFAAILLARQHTSSPVSNQPTPTPLIQASQPMAIIYTNGRDNYFHVQNGTAARDISTDYRWITFSFIDGWQGNMAHHETIYVCRPGTFGSGCHREPGTNKQWALLTILPYPGTYDNMTVGPAISFKEGKSDPLNGSYRCFQTGKAACSRPDVQSITQKAGTLHYLHYVNPQPPHGLTPFEAKDARDFKLVEEMLHGTISAMPAGLFAHN
ncbi:hypothetical protein [Dictyobacter aurantiacus]|uniref:Uncharacterized protein n=1 Tax=Dictyobacter aurantiacus TaxID=1936993 RepID=A0A401ZK22_9CHLR|nr:hypothetical protein [Dictyobacter aurantiacus]GCE07203.1 hypothetical protein KDAU_45320 [Dictyobacter aurantiacus]